jgi:hypothetical protein
MPASGRKNTRPPTFELHLLDQVRGKLKFYKLLKNDQCPFDDFLTQLAQEGNLVAEVYSAFNLLEQVANNRPLPGTKCHPLGPAYTHQANGKSYRVRQHEIKTKNLRVYYFHLHPTGEIVVLAGKKSTQQEDINAFDNLVSQYLDFLSTT